MRCSYRIGSDRGISTELKLLLCESAPGLPVFTVNSDTHGFTHTPTLKTHFQ